MISGKTNLDEVKTIVLLHKGCIPTGFLSQQSLILLEALYLYLIENEIVYVARRGNRVIGFVYGTVDTRDLYKEFLKQHLKMLILFVAQNILSFGLTTFIRKAVETLFIPDKLSIEGCLSLPELLSIAIGEEFRVKSIGKILLQRLEKS